MVDLALERPRGGKLAGLNALNLKVIALTFMIIEHFTTYFYDLLPRYSMTIAEYPGRIVGPIFLFLLVESMFHTRSRKKYLARMWMAAGIMAVGNFAVSAFVRTYSNADPFYPVAQNIFLTLALAATIIALWERFKHLQGGVRVVVGTLAVLLSVSMILAEGGIYLLPALYIFYVLRGRTRLMLGALAAYSIGLAAFGWFQNPEFFWASEGQWAQLAAIPLIALYNGAPGSAGYKWLFYTVYPLHIWGFYAISALF